MSDRLAVRKTYKLYVNGAFPRSESGRTYEVTDAKGHFLANAAWASRKDARDAVVAARGAFAKWSGMTAYNRGQVLYRVAEVMEGRHVQFCEEVAAGEGLSPSKARAAVDAAIDRWVWYAGLDRQAGRRRSAGPTRSPARTSTSRCPSRPASSPSWRRSSPRCSAWSACWRRCSPAATPPSS